MDTARIDDIPAPPCDDALLAAIESRICPPAAPGMRWRIALLGPCGEPYRVIHLEGLCEYVELAQLLRAFGFCPALPRDGYDEVYRHLWPAQCDVAPSPRVERPSPSASTRY